MNTTLDKLSSKHKKNWILSFLNEVKVFLLLFVVVSMWMIIFTNLDLFSSRLLENFWAEVKQVFHIKKSDVYQDQKIIDIVKEEEVQEDNNIISSQNISDSTADLLKSKLSDYDFNFNTLPPINKIIIPSIALDVTIIESKFKNVADFTNGNFDSELQSGVVKYPTTPNPWEDGNSLIFWHTSQERWKKNPYWTVFKDIPRLETGSRIQVIWEWNMHEYEVIWKIVVYPNQVNQEYLKYQTAGGKFLTLMWCYPLGTDKKRMMIFSKLVE